MAITEWSIAFPYPASRFSGLSSYVRAGSARARRRGDRIKDLMRRRGDHLTNADRTITGSAKKPPSSGTCPARLLTQSSPNSSGCLEIVGFKEMMGGLGCVDFGGGARKRRSLGTRLH